MTKITRGGSSRLAPMRATSPLISSGLSRLAPMRATSPLIPSGSSRFSHMQSHLHESYLALHLCGLPRLIPGGSSCLSTCELSRLSARAGYLGSLPCELSRLASMRIISPLIPGWSSRLSPMQAISPLIHASYSATGLPIPLTKRTQGGILQLDFLPRGQKEQWAGHLASLPCGLPRLSS